jgi:hypothetical protein
LLGATQLTSSKTGKTFQVKLTAEQRTCAGIVRANEYAGGQCRHCNGDFSLLVLLVLGIVVGIPQIASFFGKKKRQAEIRRRVRSTLIEETTGFSVNERLRAKRKSISPSQDLDFCELHSAEGLELPERVDGWLDLSGLTTVEGLKLPRQVGGDLDLKGLTTAEGLEFPEYVGGWIDLRGLTTSRGLKLPEVVVGDIYFWSLPKSEYARLSHGPPELGGEVRFEPLVDEDRMTMIRLRGGRRTFR